MEKTFEGLSGMLVMVYFAIILNIIVMEGMKTRLRGKMNIVTTLVQNVFLMISMVISLFMCFSKIEGSPDDKSQHFFGVIFIVINMMAVYVVNMEEKPKKAKQDNHPVPTITHRYVEEFVIDKRNERIGIRKINEQSINQEL